MCKLALVEISFGPKLTWQEVDSHSNNHPLGQQTPRLNLVTSPHFTLVASGQTVGDEKRSVFFVKSPNKNTSVHLKPLLKVNH